MVRVRRMLLEGVETNAMFQIALLRGITIKQVLSALLDLVCGFPSASQEEVIHFLADVGVLRIDEKAQSCGFSSPVYQALCVDQLAKLSGLSSRSEFPTDAHNRIDWLATVKLAVPRIPKERILDPRGFNKDGVSEDVVHFELFNQLVDLSRHPIAGRRVRLLPQARCRDAETKGNPPRLDVLIWDHSHDGIEVRLNRHTVPHTLVLERFGVVITISVLVPLAAFTQTSFSLQLKVRILELIGKTGIQAAVEQAEGYRVFHRLDRAYVMNFVPLLLRHTTDFAKLTSHLEHVTVMHVFYSDTWSQFEYVA